MYVSVLVKTTRYFANKVYSVPTTVVGQSELTETISLVETINTSNV